jgi:eukaryotic-like serine/threonine-protein kinase
MSITRPVYLLADRYRLDDQIAVGGMGEVWRATDLVLGRPVAVKLLRAEYVQHPEILARFRAEARHAGSLSNPHIARVFDYGEAGATHPPFLVMELVDGPPVTRLLARGPMEPARVMDLVAQAADGLAAAHAAGLVHRDIKPGNLLLAPPGQVKITDFGIAYAAGSAPITRTGMLVGTPAYVAPERVAGAGATPASDLYSLGIVAYECLAGALPFSGTAMEVALSHQMRSLPPLPATVPAEAAALVAELTAKDPAARPASAGEVMTRAGRLRDAMAGAPPAEAAPPPAGAAPPPAGPAFWPAPHAAEAGAGPASPTRADAWPAPPSAGAGTWPAPPSAGAGAWSVSSPAGAGAPPTLPPAAANAWPAPPPAGAGAWPASPPTVAADAQADTLIASEATLREFGTPGPPRVAQHRLVPSDRGRRRRVIVLAVAAAAVVALAWWALADLAGGTFAGGRPAAASTASPHSQPSTPMVQVNADALIGQPVGVVTRRLRHLGLRVRVEFAHTDGRPPGTVLSVQPSGPVAAGSSVTVTAARPQHGHGHDHGHGGEGGNGQGND